MQRGFVQIPVLIAIIVGVLVLGGVSYIGVKQYQNYSAQKVEQDRITQEKEKVAWAVLETQQKALDQAQAEIDTLKKENQDTQNMQKQLEQKMVAGSKSTTVSISSEEIQPFLSAVINVQCFLYNNYQLDNPENVGSSGSGTFWKWNGEYAILTNDHVMMPGHTPNCDALWPFDESAGQYQGDSFRIDRSADLDWNKSTDVRVALIGLDGVSAAGAKAEDANYNIYSLRKCSLKMPIGSPVIIIGFPSSTQTYPIKGGNVRTISNGVISGYDKTVQIPLGQLPGVNYFVSNKIDSGNSGGAAISKDKDGLCMLGIPTWLKEGHYDTQGIIQNILNVLSKQ